MSFKVPPNGSFGLRLTVLQYTLNVSLNGKGKHIHIFVVMYDQAMRSPLSIQRKFEKNLTT